MMATVPLLQQTPTEEIDTGGTPLFSPTNIEPVKDTGVAKDLQKLSQTQMQFAQIAVALQDEQDDIKSSEALRGYQGEADEKLNEYLNLQLGDAIATVGHDEENNNAPITRYDQFVNDLTDISEKYLGTLDNKNQKTIFSSKYAASKRIAVNSASKHSLKQSRLKLTEESKADIDIQKNRAIASFETWQQEDGDYETSYIAMIAAIKRHAELNGRNTDIEKGPLSSKYLLDVQTSTKAVMEGVVKNLMKLRGGHVLAQRYVERQKPPEIKDVPIGLEIKIADKHEDYNVEQCVDGVLTNNGDQNSGSYVDQASLMMCLKSNHYVDDGNGGSVQDGLHSNRVNLAGQTQEDNKNTLEKLRSESKFFRLGSDATLIDEHQPTHTFATLHLGVEKADSLYTKARKLIYTPEDKKNTRIQTQEINEENKDDAKIILLNKKVIGKYNELINEEVNKLYGKTKGDFVAAIANDLEIIEKGINYGGEVTSDVDFVTGLRPLNVLKQELKDTITDPTQLKYALKDLENKYNKTKNKNTEVYNEGLNKAKEIAFTEPGGWKNLEANGINIEDFTKEDQEILKNGPPEESDKATLVKLEKNPLEVRDNLPAYRHQISRSEFASLSNYARSLKSEGTVLAVTVENDMLDLTLKNFNMGYIKDETFDDGDYLQIKGKWKQLIDEEQTNTGSKLTRQRKQELLNGILTNTVIYDYGVLQHDHRWPSAIINKDQMENTYVKVGGETIWLKTIPAFQREKIIKKIRAKGLQVTEQLIADMWVFGGKSKINNQYDWDKYNLEKGNTSTSSLK